MRKRKRRGYLLAILLFIFSLMLMGIIGMLLYARYKEAKEPRYEYISMTEEASARAYVWLSQIENNELSFEEVKECMGEFNIELVSTPLDEKGVFNRKIADGAYDSCVSQATAGLESAYRLAVKKRLKAAGYEGEITDGIVESLMSETYGISVSEYLKTCEVTLLPSIEDLKSEYEGEIRDEKKQ